MNKQDLHTCAERIRVVHPLFHTGGDGSSPISALNFNIAKIDKKLGVGLNKCWHSRLPEITNWQGSEIYGAEYGGKIYAVAIWGNPVARMLNNKGWWELRRMAIAPDAPKNTASRMLKIMRLLIKKDHPEINKLISYQDTDVHNGTIYKAAGWKQGRKSEGGEWTRPSRWANKVVAPGIKIRWEYDL